MPRRLWAFAVVLVIASGPFASLVCQLTCAGLQANTAAAGHAHHHSCTQAQPGSGVALTAVPHTCDYQSDQALAFQQTIQSLSAPVLLDRSTVTSPPPDRLAVPFQSADAAVSPPGLLALASQLRV